MYYVSFVLNLFLLYITRGLNWKTIFSLGEAEGTFMPVSEFCPCHNKYYNGGHTKKGYACARVCVCLCVCIQVYIWIHGDKTGSSEQAENGGFINLQSGV